MSLLHLPGETFFPLSQRDVALHSGTLPTVGLLMYPYLRWYYRIRALWSHTVSGRSFLTVVSNNELVSVANQSFMGKDSLYIFICPSSKFNLVYFKLSNRLWAILLWTPSNSYLFLLVFTHNPSHSSVEPFLINLYSCYFSLRNDTRSLRSQIDFSALVHWTII